MDLILIVVLLIFLILVVYADITTRKIPNRYTFPIILFGVILGFMISGARGALSSLLGFAVGVLIFIIPFSLGGMGAGDVKMMGAIGALMGPVFVFRSALLTAVSGGILALAYIIYKLGVKKASMKIFGPLLTKVVSYVYIRTGNVWFGKKADALRTVQMDKTKYYIPYAIPIAIGTIVALLIGYF